MHFTLRERTLEFIKLRLTRLSLALLESFALFAGGGREDGEAVAVEGERARREATGCTAGAGLAPEATAAYAGRTGSGLAGDGENMRRSSS